MYLATPSQMKAAEANAVAAGETYIGLMENAGAAAVQELCRYVDINADSRVLIICGRGNNGGDGFVLARVAALEGWQVTVLLAEGEPKTPDAITNYARLAGLQIALCRDAAALEPQHFRVVADALYGTGFHGSLRPAGRAACRPA